MNDNGRPFLISNICISDFLQAFEKNNVEKDVAENIKKMFDKKYGPTWHCIVGKNFGNQSLTHCLSSRYSLQFCSFRL